MIAAEDAAESFDRSNMPENYTFYSAKDSCIAGDTEQCENVDNSTYTPMELYPDSRFYNIPVNLNYSIVHVPTNIYYEGK
jgi:voltage-dependent calcium channel alpha-2/delta-4